MKANKGGIHRRYLALLAALFVLALVPGTSAAPTLAFQRGDGKGAPSETDDAELRTGDPRVPGLDRDGHAQEFQWFVRNGLRHA